VVAGVVKVGSTDPKKVMDAIKAANGTPCSQDAFDAKGDIKAIDYVVYSGRQGQLRRDQPQGVLKPDRFQRLIIQRPGSPGRFLLDIYTSRAGLDVGSGCVGRRPNLFLPSGTNPSLGICRSRAEFAMIGFCFVANCSHLICG